MKRMTYTKKQFPIARRGTLQAVLADVFERETLDGKVRVVFVWLTTDEDDEGHPVQVFQSFNDTWNPKGRLRGNVAAILGYDPGDDYDIEELLGINVLLNIVHNVSGGKTYANINGLVPITTNTEPLLIPDEFIRKKDKKRNGHQQEEAPPEQTQEEPPPEETEEAVQITDDDIPF